MKIKNLSLCSALSLGGLLTSGCYTVISNPYAQADLHEREVAYAAEAAPTVGQFDERDDMDDFYRYPGVRGSYGGYGYGGYPSGGFGYSSNGGFHPYGGYDPYYRGGYGGYGPYSYGYDPYYRDSGGYYVPPGYELVSTRELDDLRSGALGAATPTVDPAAAARLKEREENIWMKRVEPRVRQAPTPTARPQAVSAPRTPAATPRTSSASSSASSTPASKSTGTKKSASPPKKRRR